MIQRVRRPMADGDRRLLEEFRQREIGPLGIEARASLLGAGAGFVVGLVWMAAFHFGDRSAPLWPVGALVGGGGGAGLVVDWLRARSRRNARAGAAAAHWDPVVAVGVVERVVAEAPRALRIDDDQSGSAWFLDVGGEQLLCVWDWVDQACDHLEIEIVPGDPPTTLAISWTGQPLESHRPKRRFKRGEHQPKQCELLPGKLEQVDQLLGRPARRVRPVKAPSLPAAVAQLESLGFFKYLPADLIDEVKAESSRGARRWLRAAERAFDADAERLAEGGVSDLIDEMRSALQVEGCTPGAIQQEYSPEGKGYVLTIAGEVVQLWDHDEAKRSWELTTARTAALINRWLTQAGSQERVHLLGGGNDALFVLLTPAMHDSIAGGALLPSAELPRPL